MTEARADYRSPSEKAIHGYAQQVCERLAAHRNDTTIADQEVVSGLAALLKLLFRLEAKRLNNFREA